MTDNQGFKLVLVEGEEGVRALWEVLGKCYEPPLQEVVPGYCDYIKKLVDNAQTYGLYAGEDLAGGVSFYANDAKGGSAYISQLAIHSAYRGRGLGRALVEGACDLARAAGMRKIRLEVLCENAAARSLYEKAGFEYEETPGVESLFMARPLL